MTQLRVMNCRRVENDGKLFAVTTAATALFTDDCIRTAGVRNSIKTLVKYIVKSNPFFFFSRAPSWNNKGKVYGTKFISASKLSREILT